MKYSTKLKQLVSYDPLTGVFTNNATGARADRYNVTSRYTQVCVDGDTWQAHRLAFLLMTGKVPKFVDHINHVRDDNRWDNLRPATRSDNNCNVSKRVDNVSGVTGVTRRHGNWFAQIQYKGKKESLGTFGCKTAAILARKAAEITYGFHPNHGI